MTSYTSQYPPAHNSTYVKATTYAGAAFYQYFATDPAKSLTGSYASNCWLSESSITTNQRFHIDLGEAKYIRRIYYENIHSSGANTNQGAKNFVMQGSNSSGSFDELTYATDTGWTALSCASNIFAQHVAADQADPQYILVDNSEQYRYIAFKVADNWGSSTYMGLRRIVVQTEDGWTPAKIMRVDGVLWGNVAKVNNVAKSSMVKINGVEV